MIHYIVAFYNGPRRNKNNFQANLKLQIKAVQQFSSITKATFVLNQYQNETIQVPDNIQIIIRPNLNCSYGAWHHAILQHIHENYDFFLTEDDYVPTDNDFTKPYYQQMNDNAYVCGFIRYDPVQHAAIPNGLLNHKKAQIAYKEYGNVFKLTDGTDYNSCEYNQLHFLEYLKNYSDIVNQCLLPHEFYPNILRFSRIGQPHHYAPNAPTAFYQQHHLLN